MSKFLFVDENQIPSTLLYIGENSPFMFGYEEGYYYWNSCAFEKIK